MEKTPKNINQFVYSFSLLTWMVNICFIIIPFFVEVSGIWMIGIFASVLIQGIVSGAFCDETLIPKATQKHQLIDCSLAISKYVSISLAAVGFISLIIGGGGPEMIDQSYYLVNHGDAVRQISAGWFVYFVICEMLVFSCGLLYFSALMAQRIRGLYLLRKQ